jgi:23S rRNA G2445 N2-methylase RlmL
VITYYSTFITGFREVIEDALKKKLKDVQIDLVLDGLVAYKSNKPPKEILSLRFLNNTFLLLQFFDEKERPTIEGLVNFFLQNRNSIRQFPHEIIKGKRSFRIITSDENRLVSIDKKTLEKLENSLGNMLKLEINRARPDVEVWFLKRREGFGFVGIRLTKTPNYEKTLRKGELRPELAHILCLLSEPKPDDVFLDPFAGSGAIPVERTTFPYSEIVAADKDSKAYKYLKERVDRLKKRIKVRNWDAINLQEVENSTIDKIVTDPPWGIYEQNKFDLPDFYKKMVKEFLRITKKGGLIVILTAQKELFEEIMSHFYGELILIKKYDTLVSGRKASVYKIKKI